MTRNCLHCGRDFTPEFATDAFDATYCQQAWWMTSTAAREWEALEPKYRAEWSQAH